MTEQGLSSCPLEPNAAALQATLAKVVVLRVGSIRGVGVPSGDSADGRAGGTLTLQPPGHLSELCNMVKATLQRKTACLSGTGEEDEDQAETTPRGYRGRW